jgi:benzoate/toluate 1,2-dioxygenase reductase component
MAIQKSELILVSKKQLTHDVFELIFTGPIVPDFLPGQYITFLLPSGIRRSYSIAFYESGKYTFIIKKVAGGRGSVEICDLAPGLPLTGMLPLGHFVLPNHGKNFCFIGTGTGFAPLYCQIKSIEEKYSDCHARFIF